MSYVSSHMFLWSDMESFFDVYTAQKVVETCAQFPQQPFRTLLLPPTQVNTPSNLHQSCRSSPNRRRLSPRRQDPIHQSCLWVACMATGSPQQIFARRACCNLEFGMHHFAVFLLWLGIFQIFWNMKFWKMEGQFIPTVCPCTSLNLQGIYTFGVTSSWSCLEVGENPVVYKNRSNALVVLCPAQLHE